MNVSVGWSGSTRGVWGGGGGGVSDEGDPIGLSEASW